MNKIIVYINQMNTVSICAPTGEISVEEVQQKDVPNGVQSFIIDRSALPTDVDFHGAWELNEGVISINIDKAKDITKSRLRMEREPLLSVQDIAFQRALETGADTTAIIAEKQRLRDITNLTDSCTTLDELRALHC